MGIDVIQNCDFYDISKNIHDGSVDAIITDPPYGITKNKWDNIPDLGKMWAEFNRVIKPNGAICIFASCPFDKILACSNIDKLKYEYIWVKDNSTGFLNAKAAPLKIHENILVFSDGCASGNFCNMTYNPIMRKGFAPYKATRGHGSTNYGKCKCTTTISNGDRYPIDVLYFAHDTVKLHPTQKPVALVKWLIDTYSNKGETILDPFMGGGTTAEACIRSGRHFIGTEINKDYYDKAMIRLNKVKNENTLF